MKLKIYEIKVVSHGIVLVNDRNVTVYKNGVKVGGSIFYVQGEKDMMIVINRSRYILNSVTTRREQ